MTCGGRYGTLPRIKVNLLASAEPEPILYRAKFWQHTKYRKHLTGMSLAVNLNRYFRMQLPKFQSLLRIILIFSIYPLWRPTLKSCIDLPLLLQPLVDDNGLDIYLSDGINIIDRCSTQFPLLNGCNTAADFVRILYEIIATDKSIQTNFVLQMKIYELIYGVALYLNNIDISQDVYIQISNQISGWDKKIFNYWYSDKDTTLSKLLEFEANKRRIVKNVVLNSSDPKVIKLPTYKFLV